MLCTFGSRFARTPKPGEVGDLLEVGDWLDVFRAQHGFDAHAWPYVRYFDDEPAPPVRARSMGGKVDTDGLFLCHFVFLDYDASSDHPGIMERLEKVPEDHYLYRAACIYPTKSGMRLVYRLATPVTTDLYGPLVRGMAMDLVHITGLEVDPTTDQWSRCFRLPKVTRNDEKATGPTWEEPYYFDPLISEDSEISPDEVKSRDHKLPWDKRGKSAQQAPEKKPDSHDIPPARKKLYKTKLRQSRFYDYLFEEAQIQEGRRDQTLLAMSGEIVKRVFLGVPESSAEETFALILPVTADFRQDGEPWSEKLWRMVRHAWNEEAKKEQDRQNQAAVDKTQRDVITKNMLTQLPVFDLPPAEPERTEWIQRHYVLATAGGCYPVRPDGTYQRFPMRASQLPAHFNDNLHCLIEGGFRDKTGKPMGGADILNRFSTNIDDVEFAAENRSGVRLEERGSMKVLVVSPFELRTDLLEAAEYDKEVGEWLSTFHDSALLQRWLVSALSLSQGPTAACYLYGPARVGKSMLARGLADCFGVDPAPGNAAFSDFNGKLLHSPIVMIDEGLPTKITGAEVADVFRSLVTGSSISAQKKFQDQVTSNVPYRLIFAANSFDMVKQLIGKRTLGAQDREAFRERILVIETGERPAQWLDKHGAMNLTRYSPKGAWIGAECRLARHLLKMWIDNQPLKRDGRMIVAGRAHPGFTLSFDLSGGGRDVVDELVQAIVRVKTQKVQGNHLLYQALRVEHGQVWLKKRPFVRAVLGSNSNRIDTFSTALDRFLTNTTRQCHLDFSMQSQVDMDKLIYCASAQGLPTVELTALRLSPQGVS